MVRGLVAQIAAGELDVWLGVVAAAIGRRVEVLESRGEPHPDVAPHKAIREEQHVDR